MTEDIDTLLGISEPGVGHHNMPVTPQLSRYTDGYHAASIIVGMGTLTKVLAVIAFIIIAVAGVAVGSEGDAALAVALAGFLLGGVVWLMLFVMGIFVSAQGQVLRAALDTAVHTSPFLTHEQKQSVMR